ncbi:flagellar biosynthesis regulator FlaF [Phenylobacterium sp.]|jgi:flagellar protein FlaF|uniref:flagellar biosynthesis regulator FlaF n=1 Tax=Phenylobacterium sp. TaxID=1871053 RepID=UPI002F3EF46B
MSLRAYQQAATRVENPRETEYRLFAQVTLALIEAGKADISDIPARIDALDWNRRVWTTLSDDCSSPGNRLPPQLRASIISLAIFVGRHTSKVIRGQEPIDLLVDINRTVMQGLMPAPLPSSAAA